MLNRTLSQSLKFLFNSSHPSRYQRRRMNRQHIQELEISVDQLEQRTMLSAITIDPGGYLGVFRIENVAYVGQSTLELSPGSHSVLVAKASSFSFTVDTDGNVTSSNSAAEGSGSTLTFNNTSVLIDPAAYGGIYSVGDATRRNDSGSQSMVLVPNINGYFLTVPGFGLSFDVAANGDVTSNNTFAANANGAILTFNTTTINIDPVNYVGQYSMGAVSGPIKFGTNSFVVIPGLFDYRVSPTGGFFRYNVDANGNVTSPDSDSMFGVGNTLFFKNSTINIDPGDYSGQYGNSFGGTVDPGGFRSVVVVPGIGNGAFQFRNGGDFVRFAVNAVGNVTSKTPLSAIGVGDTLFFKNSILRIDPTDYTGTYEFQHVLNGLLNGVQDVVVVPSLGYRLNVTSVAGNFLFDVAADCQPTPSIFPFSVSGESFALDLSCVTNTAPQAVAGGTYPVTEGSDVTLDGSASNDAEQSSASLTYEWDLDSDGIFGEVGTGATRGDEVGINPNFSAAGLDGPSSVVVSLRVTDDDGLTNTDTATINVNNVAPHNVVIDDAVISTHVLAVGESETFSGSFADAGTPDTHTAVWTFRHVVGLSTVEETRTGTVSQGAGSGTVSDSFSFADAGVYTVTLTITDDDTGKTASEESMFVIYDPAAGFVTGGGWFDSAAGAYIADESLTGKANFGFVAKYKKGSTTLTGQTAFQFKTANLKFHSDEYIWLVIAGARAQYQGTGTINGSGNYGFKLTAIDGQVSGGGGVDKIRLKIWDKNNGDAIVYDSGVGAGDDADPSTTLGGGKIIIHSNGNALQAVGGAANGGTTIQSLSYTTLLPVVNQAIEFWAYTGADASQLNALSQIDVHLADLSGSYLGISSASSKLIWIDVDAAGYGWGSEGMDLLSTVSHEVGHALGFDHEHDGVMAATLAVGERHLPGEEYHREAVLISMFVSNNQDNSTSDDSLGAGIIASPQPLAEKSNYALENDFKTSMTDDDSSSSAPVPYLPEEDLDPDSFFSEFANSLLDDLLAIS